MLKNSYLVAVEAQLPPLAASGPEADHLTPWCLVPGDLKFARGIVILLVFTPAGSLMVYAVHGAPLSALLCSLPTVKSVAPMICKFQPTTCNTSTSVCSCSVMADCANEYATYRAPSRELYSIWIRTLPRVMNSHGNRKWLQRGTLGPPDAPWLVPARTDQQMLLLFFTGTSSNQYSASNLRS